jgi:hypothetical protein
MKSMVMRKLFGFAAGFGFAIIAATNARAQVPTPCDGLWFLHFGNNAHPTAA